MVNGEGMPHRKSRTYTTDPLLTTKFIAPRLPKHYVTRHHLISQLEQGSSRRLTLVNAPAGYGKSTLLTQWIQETNHPVAWLSLDSEENDPLRFFSYLFRALEQINPSWIAELLGLISSYHAAFLESFMRAVINILAGHSERFILILDDFHVIQSHDVLCAMEYLVENQPPNLHIVISGRGEPQLPTARLRVQDELSEIRIDQLRFSLEEIDVFFQTIGNIDIASSDIKILESRTEGWVAGIQLAAYLLKTEGNVENAISGIRGESRYIMDYLVQEVLAQQPEHIQVFLLKTSVLNQLTGPLCDAVAGLQSSQMALEYLDANSIFLIPLDHERRQYRYHQLFQEILLRRLQEIYPEEIKTLHQRASLWLAEEGFLQESIYHAIRGEDYSRAADIVQRIGQDIMNQGRFLTFHTWTGALPEELLSSRPILCRGRAWTHVMVGDIEDVDLWIQRSREGHEEYPDISMEVQASINCNILNIQSMAEQVRGNHRSALQLALEAKAILPDRNKLGGAVTYANIGDAQLCLEDLDASFDAYTMSATFAEEYGQTFVFMKARYYLCKILIMQGLLSRAEAGIQEARERLPDRESFPPLAGFHLSIGRICYERNNIQKAEKEFQQALRLARLSGDYYYILDALQGLGQVSLATRDFNQAEEHFRDAHRLAHWANAAIDIKNTRAWMMWSSLACDNVDDLEYRVESIEISDACESFPPTSEERLNLIRMWIRDPGHTGGIKKIKEARDLILRERESANEAGNLRRVVQLQLLNAITFDKLGLKTEGLERLLEPLSIGAEYGCIRVFMDEDLLLGGSLSSLCSSFIEEGEFDENITLKNLARKIIASISIQGISSTDTKIEKVLKEPLTTREVEIFRLYIDGLTSREIAEELFISFHTVRTHLRNIYNKLDVHNRVEAVECARQLNLF
jgi:LuxR family maltose regulon positive regulatory protein